MREKSKRLITGLVIVAAAAIVCAIAGRTWNTHTIRNRVSDATKAVDAAKLVVMEAATVHGGLDHIQGADLPMPQPAALASPYAATVSIADGGRITLSTKDTGSTRAPVLQFVPEANRGTDDGSIVWHCVVLSGDASLAPQPCAAETRATPAPGPAAATSVPRPAVSSSH